MSRHFGELYSNSEKIIFKKGIWELTEDGEKTWSLYCKGQCFDPIVDENKYMLFDQGFLLYTNNRSTNSYRLFNQNDPRPIFCAVGDSVDLNIEDGLLIFSVDNRHEVMFDSMSLLHIKQGKESQLGIDL